MGDVSSIVIDKKANFITLIAYFKKECNYALEGLHSIYYSNAAFRYIVFIGDSNDKDPAMLLMVADGIHHSSTLMPLVLAETILALMTYAYPDQFCS